MTTDWTVEERQGTVEYLHGLEIGAEPVRLIRRCAPTNRSLVLGKSQPESDVNSFAVRGHRVSVVRRSSGGGAVLVEPGDVWIDVIIPAADPNWNDDVGKAFLWLGHQWRQVLESLGVSGVAVHEGAMIKNELSGKICFAGLGPGECLVNGRKVVGISQRRVRAGAVFQCLVITNPDVAAVVHYLALTDSESNDARDRLDETVGSVELPSDKIWTAFLGSFG